jgi:hypothetical protein
MWVEREGVRVDISEIEAQWREDDRLGYRARLADGASLLLYYVPELDLWSGTDYAGHAAPAVRRRQEHRQDAL